MLPGAFSSLAKNASSMCIDIHRKPCVKSVWGDLRAKSIHSLDARHGLHVDAVNTPLFVGMNGLVDARPDAVSHT